jgi:cob(I)alamin adenosyltransferase
MYNRRVSKTDARVEACGAIDEFNSAIGVARAGGGVEDLSEKLLKVQRDLITLMGEIATLPEDMTRYVKDGFQLVSEEHYSSLETWIQELEARKISFKGWATPGATSKAAALDMALSICRRAERRVQRLIENESISNRHILIYLNRCSDLLWLLARAEEARTTEDSGKIAKPV